MRQLLVIGLTRNLAIDPRGELAGLNESPTSECGLSISSGSNQVSTELEHGRAARPIQ